MLEEQLTTLLALHQSTAHMQESFRTLLVLSVLLVLFQMLEITTAADVRLAMWRLEAILAITVRQGIWVLLGQSHLAAALYVLQAVFLSTQMDIHTAEVAVLELTARLLQHLCIAHAQQEPIR